MIEAIQGVICDLDGTLVDTRTANESAYRAAFEAEGVLFDVDVYRRAFGLRFDEMAKAIAPGRSVDDLQAVRRRKASVYPSAFHLLTVNTALVALLQTLRATGLKIALASTASATNVLAVLSHTGLTDLFDTLVTGEDVLRGKPAPDCYELAAARMRVSASRCLAFEDSEIGVASARAAGCRVLEVRL